MNWLAPNTLFVLVGTSLLGACMGLVGAFAVLRRRALVGDALAHATLPGICLAYLAVGRRSFPALMLGALLSGLVGILVLVGLRRFTKVKDDAAVGIVLSVFFGAGVVLLSVVQRQGAASAAGLETFVLGTTAGILPEDGYWIGGTLLLCGAIVTTFLKEFEVVAFDSQFATVQGWPAARLDLLLMAMIAVTVVVGLPAVGPIMVAALLILPSVTARNWTERFGRLLLLSVVIGFFTGVAGTLVSTRYNLAAGPTVILSGTALWAVSLLVAPHGPVARSRRRRSLRSQPEDATTDGRLDG